MKKSIMFTVGVATSILFPVFALLAAESCPISSGEFDKLVQSNFKNQCLIVARNCATESNTVQQRVGDLRIEIAKGLSVYTSHELRTLREQLKWIESDSNNQFI